MTKGDEKILDTFLHKYIRSILKIYWPEKITNTEARRKRAGLEKISTIVKKRRWQWIGHVLRIDNNRNARTALDWAPEGKRKRGRPKETWRRTVEKERKQLGFNTWAEATRQVQDRSKWRGLVHGPILHEETGN
jgi:predicted ArsR family transcriptional regulator